MTDISLHTDEYCTAGAQGLRIAVVSDAAPHRNGVGAYYKDLEHHLSERVAAMLTISPSISNGRWKGGLAFPLPGDATQKCMLPNPVGLWRKLKAFQPDAVIIPTPGPYGIAGAFLAKKLKCKVIIGFHTWYEKLTELYWDKWQGKLTKGYFDVSNKILFNYADQVVVNSEFMAKTANAVSLGSIPEAILVGTPISNDFISQPVVEPTGQLTNILFVGRFAAEKNIESIIKAAHEIPSLQFSLAGDGPEREKVEAAARSLDNVNYLGWINRQELRQAMDEHDMLVLPSHVESFGTVALEAMARKRLALVSSNCGIFHWQSLQEGMIHMGSDETLTQALKRIQDKDVETRLKIAENAQNLALELNQWNVNRWLQLILRQDNDF